MLIGTQTRTRFTKPFLAVAVFALPLLLATSCASSSDDDDDEENTAPVVLASPGSSSFMAPSTQVTLTAQDDSDPSPAIYYTLDLTEPTTASNLYTGPITLASTTVLKAIAIDSSGEESAVLVQGYALVSTQQGVEWATSGHGDIAAEAWRHWDDDGDVTESCARCHGDGGLKDYAEDGVVDAPGAIPFGLACDACHTSPETIYDDLETYTALEQVAFPSGDVVNFFNASNVCITCHQGRESTVQVDEDIAMDPAGDFTFINIHYYPAGATFFGGEVRGGYEYDDMAYVGRSSFPSHPASKQDCTGCHMRGSANDHSFMPKLNDCANCHAGGSFKTLAGSPRDNYEAISAMEVQLLSQIQTYAKNVIGTAIAYDDQAYPYFFKDTNGNGLVDGGEGSYGNRYNLFDAALLKASYNYQVVQKDPGGYIHNGTYLRQLQHDSIADLGGTPSVPAPGRDGFDAEAASKAEQWHLSGHADSMAEAFRHWDDPEEDMGEVPESCARCHTSSGFIDYVADGEVDFPVAVGEVVQCKACHSNLNLFADASTRFDNLGGNAALEPVTFPSDATATLGNSSNICMTCHQGRESGLTIEDKSPNTVMQSPDYDSFDFVNRHYYAAAAILFGSDVTAAYEYEDQDYVGQNTFEGHAGIQNDCISCHGRGVADHSFEVQLGDCSSCHENIADFEELGLPFDADNVDWDGDGTGGSFQEEIDGMKANLLAAIQDYARDDLPESAPVVYGPTSYPYWFNDLDDDSELDDGVENNFGNRYRDFDRRLLQAAFNFHASQDPCSDIHNYRYTLQTLYDAIDDLDGTIDGSAPGMRPSARRP